MTYGGEGTGVDATFTHEPTETQEAMLAALQRLIKVSSSFALAAPRGEGKTTAVLWAVMFGLPQTLNRGVACAWGKPMRCAFAGA